MTCDRDNNMCQLTSFFFFFHASWKMPKAKAKSGGSKNAGPAKTPANKSRRRTPAVRSGTTDNGSASAAPARPLTAQDVSEMVAEAVREALQASAATAVAPAAAKPTLAPPMAVPAAARNEITLPQMLPATDAASGSAGTPIPPQRTEDEWPIDAVVGTIRQRIVEDRYIALGMPLDATDRTQDEGTQSFQLVNGFLRPAARTPRTVANFGSWCLAFLRFAGLYLEAHPDAAAGLMAHMLQVSQMTAPGFGYAWREFDEAFRRARETAPGRHQWGETAASSPMWLQAVVKGIGGASRQQINLPQINLPRQGAAAPFRLCFAYNLQRGCTVRSCRYQHACRTCKGPHPVHRCTARSARLRAGTAPGQVAQAGSSR